MNPIKEFYMVTAELVQYLGENKEEDRDKRIDMIENLLNKREELLKQVKAPLSQGEKALAKEAEKLNQTLVKLLEEERFQIKEDWNRLKKQEKSRNQYVNPYQSLATDGVYFDRKK